MPATVTLADLGRQIAETQVALNFVWTLLCAFLIMFMQAGFALVETGLVRAKNVGHTMAMNFFVYSIGIVAFWTIGFGLQMGGSGAIATLGGDATLAREISVTIAGKELGLFGFSGFFLSPAVFTPAVATLFIFHMMFMDTALTIPTGSMAERWKFGAFVAFSFVVGALIYPVYANWTWGGGWLSSLGRNFGLGHGHVDFAGSSAVHLTGGVLALLGAKLLGPRVGKFGPRGEVNPIPGHNLPMVVLGTFILAFGWFGFNAGSTMAGNDLRIAVVAVNTMLASAAGAIAAFALTRWKFGKPDLSMMCNGMLGGMVAITAPCAFVSPPIAVLIGGVAGVLVIEGALFIERRLRIDDPVGASAVHGLGGLWGTISVGLFANGTYGAGWNGVAGPVRGLFYGDPGQLAAALIGIAANLLWVGGMGLATLLVVKRIMGLRPSESDEVYGLDLAELGVPGYFAEPESDALEPTAPGIPGGAPRPVTAAFTPIGGGAFRRS